MSDHPCAGVAHQRLDGVRTGNEGLMGNSEFWARADAKITQHKQHCVLLAQREGSAARVVGLYGTLVEAEDAESEWARLPLDWHWSEPDPLAGWPWRVGHWHAEAQVTEEGFEELVWFDFSIYAIDPSDTA